MKLEQERRKDPRYAAHFDIRFSRGSEAAKALNAFSINFSSSGLCLQTRGAYVRGETLSLSLRVEDEAIDIDLEGVVSWVRRDTIGVRFMNIAAPVRARLERLAKALASRGPEIT